MKLLQERDNLLCSLDSTRISSHYFNSFFMNKLMDCDREGYSYNNVERYLLNTLSFVFNTILLTILSLHLYNRWTKLFNIFEKDKIFCPINVNKSHWTLLVLYIRLKKIVYYDSLGGSSFSKYLNGALRYLEDEADRLGRGFLPDEWELVSSAKYTPQQENGIDCGVFTIMFADFLSDDLPLAFSGEYMPLFRKKIFANILRGSMKYEEYKKESRIPSPYRFGIKNLGNTCYLAAIVQMLSNCKSIMDIFLDKENWNEDSLQNNQIANKLYNLATRLYKEELNPCELLTAIQTQIGNSSRFNPYNVEDADEAIIVILQAIYGVNHDFKKLTDMQYQYELICNKCRNSVCNMVPIDKYILPLEKKSVPVTLDQCFKNFEKPDINVGYLCVNCNCSKHEEFSKLIMVGDVLLIQLKRFEYSGGRNPKPRKITTKISLPQIINILENDFNLIGVVNHHGKKDKPYEGHYTADVYNYTDKIWLNANDEYVVERPVPPASMFASMSPYLILYERIKNVI